MLLPGGRWIWVVYLSFSSEVLCRTSSHIWGRWYWPMFLFMYVNIFHSPDKAMLYTGESLTTETKIGFDLEKIHLLHNIIRMRNIHQHKNMPIFTVENRLGTSKHFFFSCRSCDDSSAAKQITFSGYYKAKTLFIMKWPWFRKRNRLISVMNRCTNKVSLTMSP